jgi:hypothetical protein
MTVRELIDKLTKMSNSHEFANDFANATIIAEYNDDDANYFYDIKSNITDLRYTPHAIGVVTLNLRKTDE